MIRIFGCIPTLLFAWTTMLSAQTVEVRSGEHESFTRLVFNLPDRMEITQKYREDGVLLNFDREGLSFETDTVFERVPATRLIAMKADASTMMLSLACKCAVETFWAGERAFVVDINDETELSLALFSSTADTLPDEIASNKRLDETKPSTADAVSSKEQSTVLNPPLVGSVAFLISDANTRVPEVSSEDKDVLASYANRVNQSQDAIMEQIARAATQGLLAPRDTRTTTPVPPSKAVENRTVIAQDGKGTTDHNVAEGQHNIFLNAQTSVDQVLSDKMATVVNGTDSSGCLNVTRLDARTWGRDGGFNEFIGPLRSKILGEFDQPSEADIDTLTRFYIHYGFGAEARQVNEMLPNTTEKDPVLVAMINILQHGHDVPGSILAAQMDCDPMVAVWSLLSYENVPGNQPIDPNAIVRGLLSFPSHLRAYLGPIVGTKLLRAGYSDASDQIARSLLRNENTSNTAASYLSIQGLDARASDGSSRSELEDVVAANAEPSASALLQLIEEKIEAKAAVSGDLAVLAGAYAMEYRDAAIGPDLARAYLLGLVLSGELLKSFEEFDRLSQAGPVPPSGVYSELVLHFTEKAADPIFLRHAMDTPRATRLGLNDHVGNAVAKRLITLGFPEAAEDYIAPLGQGASERERKLLRAEMALLKGKPRMAELELIGETSNEALILLARARGMAGEFSSAQDIFTRAGANDDALRQAWLDQDWERLQSHSDPTIVAIADRQTSVQKPDRETSSQILARNRAMVEDSQTIRSEIEALLSGLTVPISLEGRNP